jgi:hypothetical protein
MTPASLLYPVTRKGAPRPRAGGRVCGNACHSCTIKAARRSGCSSVLYCGSCSSPSWWASHRQSSARPSFTNAPCALANPTSPPQPSSWLVLLDDDAVSWRPAFGVYPAGCPRKSTRGSLAMYSSCLCRCVDAEVPVGGGVSHAESKASKQNASIRRLTSLLLPPAHSPHTGHRHRPPLRPG